MSDRKSNSNVEGEENLGNLALQAVEKAFAPSLALLTKARTFCIYGSGEVGVLLFHLCQARGIRPVAFLDDLPDRPPCCGVSVCGVQEGILQFNPEAILLATLRATERMTRNLDSLPYTGQILGTWDSHSQERSPHHQYIITPKQVIQQFHNKHHGRRAFIIGNGPSLLKTDPRRFHNELTLASNLIYLLEGFAPTYYAASDRILTQENAREINALPWVKFFPHQVSEWITNGHFLKGIQMVWPTNFSTDISEYIETEFTITYSLLQIAFYMGCNPVYLIGVDHTYSIESTQCYQEGRVLTSIDSDPNHFHPDYFGKGRRWTSPTPTEKLDACYQLAQKVYAEYGRKLYNATAGGALDVLPRVNFEDLLAVPSEHE